MMKWYWWYVLWGVLLLLPMAGLAHDISKARTPTEEAVFGFYATWMRPPERSMSCCSLHDCHVVEIKKMNGKWYFLDKFTAAFGWREIPEDRIEHNTPAPRESPDGSSHACFNAMYVLCAVLGSGQ